MGAGRAEWTSCGSDDDEMDNEKVVPFGLSAAADDLTAEGIDRVRRHDTTSAQPVDRWQVKKGGARKNTKQSPWMDDGGHARTGKADG